MTYLEHHGILGQKWGVRRFQNKDGTRTALGKRRDKSSDAKNELEDARKMAIKQKREDVKNRRLLSDEDLKKKLNRIKMEKEFKDITDQEVNSGEKAVVDIIGGIGKTAIVTIGTALALYGVARLVGGKKEDGTPVITTADLANKMMGKKK